ncbi:Transcription factor [Datura stramonium]|uniref:Transcription factor n=1 Tax=Datura stramonium TaxID=4076 RepID=A0ABS8VKE9_DATST|nr:Transcription factor [Datura stramonium]
MQGKLIGLRGDIMPPNDEAEEVKRLSDENKKLREMLSIMCDNYNILRKLHNNCDADAVSRKRKLAETTSTTNNNNNFLLHTHFHGINRESSSSIDYKDSSYSIQPKNSTNSTVYVRITQGSDTTLVQRSVDDNSIIVATYEGKHNHSKLDDSALNLISTNDEPKTLLVNGNNGTSSTSTAIGHSHKQPEFHKLLIEQMASSLIKDLNFKAALAASLSQKTTLPHNQTNRG